MTALGYIPEHSTGIPGYSYSTESNSPVFISDIDTNADTPTMLMAKVWVIAQPLVCACVHFTYCSISRVAMLSYAALC